MKIASNSRKRAFTLIEMIGVLAVIAILAALLVPKVFQAITEAKINTVPVGASTIKTAVIDHYAKFGGLTKTTDNATIDAAGLADYDSTLLKEGFIDKPFAPRIGTTPNVVCAAITGDATTDVALDEGLTYTLAGDGAATAATAAGKNDVTGSHVVYAVLSEVPAADAQAISTRIDGAAMSVTEANIGLADYEGRVKYAAPGTGTTTVYIYLTHR